MATARDVAKQADVSPTTVSRMVNGLVGYSGRGAPTGRGSRQAAQLRNG